MSSPQGVTLLLKGMIESYIQDCIDDPRNKEIGGKVRIGKFTLDGFEWVPTVR